ncbi:MAG: hypothetical protein ACOY3P_25805 [Planctomycetota bacterium]
MRDKRTNAGRRARLAPVAPNRCREAVGSRIDTLSTRLLPSSNSASCGCAAPLEGKRGHPRATRRPSRKGATSLLETLTIISAASMVTLLAVQFLATALHADAHARAETSRLRSAARLAHDFRRDAHAATQIVLPHAASRDNIGKPDDSAQTDSPEPASLCTFVLADGAEVRYFAAAARVERLETRPPNEATPFGTPPLAASREASDKTALAPGAVIVHREAYSMPDGVTAAVARETLAGRELAVLVCAVPRLPDADASHATSSEHVLDGGRGADGAGEGRAVGVRPDPAGLHLRVEALVGLDHRFVRPAAGGE